MIRVYRIPTVSVREEWRWIRPFIETAVAHDPKFAKKAGVPQSVGRDFANADKGRKFAGKRKRRVRTAVTY